MAKPLSEKERRFVEAYMGQAAGNGTEACRLAGYKGNSKVLGVQATRLLAKASVQAAIAERSKKRERKAIADADERDRRLTRLLRKKDIDPMVVIRAASELNKCGGRHLTRHEHSGPGGGPLVTRVIHEFTDADSAF